MSCKVECYVISSSVFFFAGGQLESNQKADGVWCGFLAKCDNEWASSGFQVRPG